MGTDAELNQEELMEKKGFVTIATAAKKLRVHKATIYRLIESGELVETKIGHARYVAMAALVKHAGPEGAKLLGLK